MSVTYWQRTNQEWLLLVLWRREISVKKAFLTFTVKKAILGFLPSVSLNTSLQLEKRHPTNSFSLVNIFLKILTILVLLFLVGCFKFHWIHDIEEEIWRVIVSFTFITWGVSSNLINIVEMKYGGEDKRCWVRGEILGEMVKGMGKWEVGKELKKKHMAKSTRELQETWNNVFTSCHHVYLFLGSNPTPRAQVRCTPRDRLPEDKHCQIIWRWNIVVDVWKKWSYCLFCLSWKSMKHGC